MAYPSILIPAYKPDQKMIMLIDQLRSSGFDRIIIVDDGSGPNYIQLFAQAEDLGCVVLRHGINMGKGRALKSGLNHSLVSGLADQGIITADADGQHSPADIQKIAVAMAADPAALILGVRSFTGNVPLKSRLGNGITRAFFSLIHGGDVRDTQTGLRGIPPAFIPLFISLPGERYEYEMNMLLAVRPNEIPLVQIPIDTIYIEGNRSSHFKVLQDSARIYRLLFQFVASSLVATGVDYLIFILMMVSVPNQLIISVATARTVSSVVNYLINRNLVFKRKHAGKAAMARYYALVFIIMLVNFGLIKLMTLGLSFNVYAAKITSDIFLFFVSSIVQRDYVYRSSK
jgi:glycosyltransferase involved in cell wall biosynthesis